jgi:glutamyl endopeptidase
MSEDAPKKSTSKKKVEQSRGNESPPAGRTAARGPTTRPPGRSVRVSNQAERQALESARPRAGAEAAPALKGEPELPFAGWPAVEEAAAVGPILPAWVASYTDPITLARLRSGVAQPEAIPSTGDDRQRVSDTEDTTAFPWRCLCRLDIASKNGHGYLGTGWLAGPKTVITAGHCVYMHDDGGWASQIVVTPAYNEGDAPYGSFTSSDLHSTDRWVHGNPNDPATFPLDYGAIFLADPLALGFFGYGVYSDDELSNMTVNVYGYPGDKNMGSVLWGHFRKLYRVTDTQIYYNIATYGGDSGCPVFFKDGDKRTAVGIHNYGGDPANYATRITDSVFDDIEAWKSGKT